MDMSPLPHKAPFVVASLVDTTPPILPMEEDKPTLMEDIQDSLMEGLQQPVPQA